MVYRVVHTMVNNMLLLHVTCPVPGLRTLLHQKHITSSSEGEKKQLGNFLASRPWKNYSFSASKIF